MEVYLDANENPYPNGVNRYPSPHQPKLKSMLSVIKKIPAENIFGVPARSFYSIGTEGWLNGGSLEKCAKDAG